MCILHVSPGYTGQFAYEDYRDNVNVTKAKKVKNRLFRNKKNSRNKSH